MKKLSAFLLILLLAVSILTGCIESSGDKSPESVSAELSGEITVYIYDDPFGHYDKITSMFKTKYSDILDVKIEKFESLSLLTDALKTSLMSGGGPDVILGTPSMFYSLTSTMNSGYFEDLAPYFEADNEYDAGQYQQTVMNAGLWGGKQIIVPLLYEVDMLSISDRNTGGVSFDGITDKETFLQAIKQYQETDSDTPLFWYPVMPYKYLFLNGIELVSDKECKVSDTLDKDAVKQILSDYSLFLKNSEQDTSVYSNYEMGSLGMIYAGDAIAYYEYDHHFTPGQYRSVGQFLRYVSGESPYNIYSVSDLDHGSSTAFVYLYACMNHNSGNKDAAYAFIKHAMSEEVQWAIAENSKFSIRNDVVEKTIEALLEEKSGTHTYSANITIALSSLTGKEKEQYLHLARDIGAAHIIDSKINGIVLTDMLTYFSMGGNFDSCYEKLINDLKIYLAE